MNPHHSHHHNWRHWRTLLLVSASTLLPAGSALANHPQPGQMDQVVRLAHQLEIDTTQAHRIAEQLAHHGDWLERQALANLHSLEEAAEHFHRQADAYRADPRHTESDWIRLNQAFNTAQATFRNLHAYAQVQALISRMTSTMSQLRWFYGQSNPGNPGGWDGQEVRRIAHQLEEAARHVHQRAEGESHVGDPWNQAALRDLHALEQAAEHFHRRVESYWQDPAHTRADYQRLQMTVSRAARSIRNAHLSWHVQNDFNVVEGLMTRLRQAYLGVGPHGPG